MANYPINWGDVHERLLSGESMSRIAEELGVSYSMIAVHAHRAGWKITEARREILEGVNGGKAKEIEIAVEEIGVRLRGASMRTRVKMAEQVEAVIGELEGTPGMNALTKSRCLASLVAVAEKVHRWGSEPTSEELARLKTAAVNIALIRTSPQELRRHEIQKAEEAGERGEVGKERA